MNLRIDLILETERRSANLVNAKSIARISAIVVPAILLVIIAVFGINMWQLSSSRNTLKSTLAIEDPKKLVVQRLESDLAANQLVLSELEGWQRSRIDWAPQLVGVQKQIPDKIQLSSLIVGYALQTTNNMPARVFTMSLSGQAVGDTAQAMVIQLQNTLQLAPALSNMFVGPPKVTRFVGPAIQTDDNRNDRLFQIDCIDKPRML